MAVQFVNNPKVGDNVKIEIGNSADLTIFHDGNSIIRNTVGDLYIDNYADDKDIIFRSDDGSGSQTAYITIDGSTGENVFYKKSHNSTTNQNKITSLLGRQLLINTNSFVLNNQGDTENMLTANADGSVNLYYNAAKKFETTANGVNVVDSELGIGAGHGTSSPGNAVVFAPYGSGTNIAGGEIQFYSGRSTGNAAGGSIKFYISPTGSSGSSANTHAQVLLLDSSKNATFAGLKWHRWLRY